MIFGDEALTAEERERLLDDVAGAVAKRGLQTPAILALEMHRPLAFTLSQGMIVFAPLFAPLLGVSRMELASRLLREPGAIDALVERIESWKPASAASSASAPIEGT